MGQLVVYGYSDDLIEIEGDIEAEIYALGDADGDGQYLAFSDGTVIKIRFDGVWRITPAVTGPAILEIVQAPEDDDDNYSDRAALTLTHDSFRWVLAGTELLKAKPR